MSASTSATATPAAQPLLEVRDLGKRFPGRAGRDPSAVRVGAVFHTVLVDDRSRALAMGRSMAAGYYEYSPTLFAGPGLAWTGPDPESLKRDREVWPDFHHAPDLEASGRAVAFLPEAAADAFCLRGGPAEIAAQLLQDAVIPRCKPTDESRHRRGIEPIARRFLA